MGASEVFGRTDTRFALYEGEVRFRERIIGGIPKEPDQIRGWLKSRLELGDRELIELAEQTYRELQGDEQRHPSVDEMLDAIETSETKGNGFKRDADGQACYEGRCVKAGLKEAANVAYPGVKFPGKPADIRKGLRSFFEERVFVDDYLIGLGTKEPKTAQRVKHIKGPQGKRSALQVFDYVDEQPSLVFTVRSLDDCISEEVWFHIWEQLEEIGLGADRSMGEGKFDLLRWERID